MPDTRATRTEATAAPRATPPITKAGSRLVFLSLSSLEAAPLTPAGCAQRAERLEALGLGAALGVDPAERRALGPRGLAEALETLGRAAPGGFVAGAASDAAGDAGTISEQVAAAAEEAARIHAAGGLPLLLPLALLSRRRAREEDYVEVYRMLLERCEAPVLLDWTGPRLRPELQDYFPGTSFERVMELAPEKVRGIRFAQLDIAHETRVRRALLARGQVLLTADREHLAHLLLGANPGFAPETLRPEEGSIALAGREAGLGDFSHALLSGPTIRADVLADALRRLCDDGVAAYLERMSEFA